ncbi:MAG TPA: N(4)-(beta-N-acetylglucosaminyl)-L-asparaginase [Candidatus Hydrogenedens sp.]|nr:N(4)-(beta-N-acetylglucosaminyl)-L-asparaginase [Candidatus Hydrogenedens sp.]HOL20521.1 N(4)-(beta-N-acetylglucosaminyl)-L-asparaginase [Candidatus Hydrogenedens sp.]HPP58768.1 N(4)-(beta-N-acetylglucosaminyl)-L-asparaginase [Candidatus Hydrogenedens sp.]
MLLLTNYEGRSGVHKSAELLKNKVDALRAIIEGIKLVEADPEIHTVGANSLPNLLGQLELDSAIMDGNTRRSGAVGAIKGFKHPIEIAYHVMTDIEHEILVGAGAERFAEEIGAERYVNEMEHTQKEWQKYIDMVLNKEQKQRFPNIRLIDIKPKPSDPEHLFDTTVYLAQDNTGRIATGTSTSGWPWKYPGRLGDSPIIGAGSYADSRYGACACTHTGEMTIRASTARSVVLYLKMGLSVSDAVYEAVNDLTELKTGFINAVTVYAIDNKGNYKVVGLNPNKEVKYFIWHPNLGEPQIRDAEIIRT